MAAIPSFDITSVLALRLTFSVVFFFFFFPFFFFFSTRNSSERVPHASSCGVWTGTDGSLGPIGRCLCLDLERVAGCCLLVASLDSSPRRCYASTVLRMCTTVVRLHRLLETLSVPYYLFWAFLILPTRTGRARLFEIGEWSDAQVAGKAGRNGQVETPSGVRNSIDINICSQCTECS